MRAASEDKNQFMAWTLNTKYKHLVHSEGSEDALREYLHNIMGLKSPRNFCKYVDRLLIYTVKYSTKCQEQYTAKYLNKNVILPVHERKKLVQSGYLDGLVGV